MQSFKQDRRTTEKRAPLWIFQKLDTIRRNLIPRAGRITRPNGKLTLTIDANEAAEALTEFKPCCWRLGIYPKADI